MKTVIQSAIYGLFLVCTISVYGQTTLSTESFGSGSAQGTSAHNFVGDMGTWTVTNTGTNGGSANNWYVSGEECGMTAGNCGIACSGGNNSLHISAIGGLCALPDCGAAYDETSGANQTNKRAISPTVDATSYYSLELNFDYIAAQGDDGFWVEYSTNNGATWTTFTGGNVAASQCCSCLDAFLCGFIGFCCPPQIQQSCASGGQGYWTAVNLIFPVAADNNPNLRFAFHWSNDGNGIGTDPSVAIDNVEITYATILPIELTSFKGYSNLNMNRIEWTSASEIDFSHYALQYSSDGENFQEIKRIFPNSAGSYFYDHQISREQNFYRLKMVDMNGDYEYSETIDLSNDLNEIHLNISNDLLYVKGLKSQFGAITIYDLSGKEVKSGILFEMSDTEKAITISDFKNGIYIIQVSSNLGDKRLKFIR